VHDRDLAGTLEASGFGLGRGLAGLGLADRRLATHGRGVRDDEALEGLGVASATLLEDLAQTADAPLGGIAFAPLDEEAVGAIEGSPHAQLPLLHLLSIARDPEDVLAGLEQTAVHGAEGAGRSRFERDARDQRVLAEDLVEHHLRVVQQVVVQLHEERTRGRQASPQQLEARAHEVEPLGPAAGVAVVFAALPRVVGGIDVDAVHASLELGHQRHERAQVVALDQQVLGRLPPGRPGVVDQAGPRSRGRVRVRHDHRASLT